MAEVTTQNSLQSSQALYPVTQKEVDGVQMGVLSDGSPYLTARGLARMCGVQHSLIITMANNWAEEKLKERGRKISELLAAQGHKLDGLYIRSEFSGVETHAYTDSACMALLEYYAFESAQAANHVALRNYRLLARLKFRAFIYNGCGYDPDKHIPDSWKNFQERVLLNDQIPTGYFSIFREIADLVVHMIRAGCPLDDHTVPDVSVGQIWAKYWVDSKLSERFGDRLKHPHNYPAWFPQAVVNPVEAWIYPGAALGEFRVWMREVYAQQKFVKYLNTKVSSGIFLPARAEMLLAAVSQQPAASPLLGPGETASAAKHANVVTAVANVGTTKTIDPNAPATDASAKSHFARMREMLGNPAPKETLF